MSIQSNDLANEVFQYTQPQHEANSPGQFQLNKRQSLEDDQFSRQLFIPYPQFQDWYQASVSRVNDMTRQKIRKWTCNRQHENYLYFIEPQKFVQFSKNQRLQHFQEHNSELITMYLLEAMKKRQDNVESAIMNDTLQIAQKSNYLKKTIPKQQESIQQPLSAQQQKTLQQQLHRRHQQIIRQHKKQRSRLQKLKQQQQLAKQKQQLTKATEQQQQKQQMRKHHSEIISKKSQQHKEKKEKQMKEHEERNKDYQYIVKSWANNVLLHQKMEKEFRKRYQAIFQEERSRIQSEKTRFSHNAKIQDLNIKQHQIAYLTKRSERQAVRAAKLQEQQRTVQTQEKQLKRYKRYKRPSEQQGNTDDEDKDQQQKDQDKADTRYSSTKRDKTYQQQQQQKHTLAAQKRKKMQQYWSTFVKEQKKPKVDSKKQLQLQNIIQSLQNARKMRKVKNQKGQYVYEELKLSDPMIKGMEYLEYAREIGRGRKMRNRKDEGDDVSAHEENLKKKQAVDYLKQLRQSRSSSMNVSGIPSNTKLAFLDKKDLSFHEKLERVDRETFKLEQLTKNSQNQLKYGKFKTSQEILQYKEDIDNNHVEILRMKIKLAANGRQ